MFSSNILQMICDAHLRIMNCVARWPGSVHDSRIFNLSQIGQMLQTGMLTIFFVIKHIKSSSRCEIIYPAQNAQYFKISPKTKLYIALLEY